MIGLFILDENLITRNEKDVYINVDVFSKSPFLDSFSAILCMANKYKLARFPQTHSML